MIAHQLVRVGLAQDGADGEIPLRRERDHVVEGLLGLRASRQAEVRDPFIEQRVLLQRTGGRRAAQRRERQSIVAGRVRLRRGAKWRVFPGGALFC